MGTEMNRCVLIGSAPVARPELQKAWLTPEDTVICADGGLRTAQAMGIKPDLLLGDFDSYDGELPEDVEIIRLPTHKDDTDMMFAAKEALSRGFTDFLILGGLGGRLDHTMANLCVLSFLALQGASALLRDEKNEALVLPSGRLKITERQGEMISVFPFGAPTCTVTYEGLEYPLEDAVLYNEIPLGVSNRILTEKAWIQVQNGPALILLSKD